MKTKWLLALHIYQPPTQRPDILDLVTSESYVPLLHTLLKYKVPIVLNVTGTLLDQWNNNGYHEPIELLQKLYTRKNFTLTTSGYTHPLLPLWPADEVLYQIKANNEMISRFINESFTPRGIYLPECAYAPHLYPLLSELKLRWTIIDEMSLVRNKYYPAVYTEHEEPFFLIRNRELSRLLATDSQEFIKALDDQPEPIVVALDGEAFGHFDPSAIGKLMTVFDEVGDQIVTPGFLKRRAIHGRVRAGTWETKDSDLKKRQPFPLWHDRKNKLHRHIWKHYYHIYRAIKKSGSLDNNAWVRRHFDNSMSSCYVWWSNLKRTAGPFNMAIWNPDLVIAGLTEGIKAVRTDPALSTWQKYQLETQHANLLKLIWQTHWKYKG